MQELLFYFTKKSNPTLNFQLFLRRLKLHVPLVVLVILYEDKYFLQCDKSHKFLSILQYCNFVTKIDIHFVRDINSVANSNRQSKN